jgi:hypothetical protein
VASFPIVCRWVALLPRQGGGTTIEAFDDKFFDWWAQHIPAIEDYPYARIKFSKDPDMPVPLEEERGEIGNMFLKLFNFKFFLYISFLYIYPSIDFYVSVIYRCGTSVPNRIDEDSTTSSTRGGTSSSWQTSSRRGSSSQRA